MKELLQNVERSRIVPFLIECVGLSRVELGNQKSHGRDGRKLAGRENFTGEKLAKQCQ